MKDKIEAVVHDDTFIEVHIPMKFVAGIISDINNLFKYKNEDGNNIGATFGTIDLKERLEITRNRYLNEQSLIIER